MKKASHVQYDIEYHIVWTTKYRYRVLDGRIAERARELIRQGCNSMDVTIISGAIEKEHIHLLVSCPPSLSVSNLVQQLKGKTSLKCTCSVLSKPRTISAGWLTKLLIIFDFSVDLSK